MTKRALFTSAGTSISIGTDSAAFVIATLASYAVIDKQRPELEPCAAPAEIPPRHSSRRRQL